MDYATVKLLHQAAVALSVGGFVVRGVASLAGARWVGGRAAKTLPHAVDTVLLGSALWLTWTLRLTPTNAPWLAAKLVGLVVYVALGIIALRPGRPRGLRATAGLAALAVVGWMVSVAVTKTPLGLFYSFVGSPG
jgi:uncharacterized membrane protein SirB2